MAFIESQDGDTLTLTAPPLGLAAGDLVTLVAGCDRLATTCETRHDNIANHGGEPGMPSRSPFDGAGLAGGSSSSA